MYALISDESNTMTVTRQTTLQKANESLSQLVDNRQTALSLPLCVCVCLCLFVCLCLNVLNVFSMSVTIAVQISLKTSITSNCPTSQWLQRLTYTVFISPITRLHLTACLELRHLDTMAIPIDQLINDVISSLWSLTNFALIAKVRQTSTTFTEIANYLLKDHASV